MRKTALLLASLLLPSCASIISGGPDVVDISSSPHGAMVTSHGTQLGTTPCRAVVPRGTPFNGFDLHLAGHHPQRVVMSRQVNGWVFGNILFGGLIGVVIDIATGNSMHVTARPVYVALIPEDKPARGAYFPFRAITDANTERTTYGAFEIPLPNNLVPATWSPIKLSNGETSADSSFASLSDPALHLLKPIPVRVVRGSGNHATATADALGESSIGTDGAQAMRLLDAKIVSAFNTLSANSDHLSTEASAKLAAYTAFVARR